MNSPERLLIGISTPSRTKRTQAMSGQRTASASKPSAIGGRPVAGDGTVVVGTPDVDQLVEPTAELLGNVADVGGEVGWSAVRADDDPILVIAEGGRPEPERAVLART